jgi:hypothetical protein
VLSRRLDSGLRQEPGTKQGRARRPAKTTTGRGKSNHSEWASQEIRVENENPTPVVGKPRELNKDETYSFSALNGNAEWSYNIASS